MKNISWRRFSILGLVLMGASAVTAAVLPDKSAEPLDVLGSLTVSTAGGNPAILSCTVTNNVTTPCNVTQGTISTAGSAADSLVGLFQTSNNTTTV